MSLRELCRCFETYNDAFFSLSRSAGRA